MTMTMPRPSHFCGPCAEPCRPNGHSVAQKTKAAEACLPQQSADLRNGSWLASVHGEGVESIIGVQRFGAPDARHRLRDEERALSNQHPHCPADFELSIGLTPRGNSRRAAFGAHC
jgi:hypothetical protein